PYGYKYVRIPGRRCMEHRLVTERHIGRRLDRSEVVHHKDGNKLNNTIENLELIQSQGEHCQRHRRRFSSLSEKECSGCRMVKSRSEFNLRGRGGHNIDLHQAYCRKCQSEYAKTRKII